jgi:hypothetical protein
MQIAIGPAGVRPLDRSANGTFRAAGFTSILIALQKSSSRTKPTHNLVAKVPGNPFGAIAPENDLFLHVDHADPDLQALQNASTNPGILKGRHSLTGSEALEYLHRHNPQRLQEMNPVARQEKR